MEDQLGALGLNGGLPPPGAHTVRYYGVLAGHEKGVRGHLGVGGPGAGGLLECAEAQCLGTCMVPCESVDDCPEAGMACAHFMCLFECDDNDEDCVQWPGYTCQHMGTLCENDGMQ